MQKVTINLNAEKGHNPWNRKYNHPPGSWQTAKSRSPMQFVKSPNQTVQFAHTLRFYTNFVNSNKGFLELLKKPCSRKEKWDSLECWKGLGVQLNVWSSLPGLLPLLLHFVVSFSRSPPRVPKPTGRSSSN